MGGPARAPAPTTPVTGSGPRATFAPATSTTPRSPAPSTWRDTGGSSFSTSLTVTATEATTTPRLPGWRPASTPTPPAASSPPATRASAPRSTCTTGCSPWTRVTLTAASSSTPTSCPAPAPATFPSKMPRNTMSFIFPTTCPGKPSKSSQKNPTPPTTTLPQWPSLTSRMTPTKTTLSPHVFPSPTTSSSSSLSFPSPNPRHDLTRDVPFSSLSLLLLFPPFPISINPKYPVPAYPSNIHPILPLLLNPLLSFLP